MTINFQTRWNICGQVLYWNTICICWKALKISKIWMNFQLL